MSGTAVCLGMRHSSGRNWALPHTEVPDGSFCLVRANENTLQLVTDPTGSRTIWYLLTDDYFIASTSQRAIVALGRSFCRNEHASAWMLSAGAPGPGYSWDKRIQMVPPNSVLSFSIAKWTLNESIGTYEYSAEKLSTDNFTKNLLNAFDEVFSVVGRYSPDWIIPLSGGVDSRGLLLLLPEPRCFQYVTWGAQDAVNNPKSDASVAARLVDHYDLAHRHIPLNNNIEDPALFFEKFLAAGEGRVSHISG